MGCSQCQCASAGRRRRQGERAPSSPSALPQSWSGAGPPARRSSAGTRVRVRPVSARASASASHAKIRALERNCAAGQSKGYEYRSRSVTASQTCRASFARRGLAATRTPPHTFPVRVTKHRVPHDLHGNSLRFQASAITERPPPCKFHSTDDLPRAVLPPAARPCILLLSPEIRSEVGAACRFRNTPRLARFVRSS